MPVQVGTSGTKGYKKVQIVPLVPFVLFDKIKAKKGTKYKVQHTPIKRCVVLVPCTAF